LIKLFEMVGEPYMQKLKNPSTLLPRILHVKAL